MDKKGECVAFGKIVRRFRESLGVSQEELAAKTRIHRTYIGGIERGERNVSIDNVERISKALGIKAAYLLGGGSN